MNELRMRVYGGLDRTERDIFERIVQDLKINYGTDIFESNNINCILEDIKNLKNHNFRKSFVSYSKIKRQSIILMNQLYKLKNVLPSESKYYISEMILNNHSCLKKISDLEVAFKQPKTKSLPNITILRLIIISYNLTYPQEKYQDVNDFDKEKLAAMSFQKLLIFFTDILQMFEFRITTESLRKRLSSTVNKILEEYNESRLARENLLPTESFSKKFELFLDPINLEFIIAKESGKSTFEVKIEYVSHTTGASIKLDSIHAGLYTSDYIPAPPIKSVKLGNKSRDADFDFLYYLDQHSFEKSFEVEFENKKLNIVCNNSNSEFFLSEEIKKFLLKKKKAQHSGSKSLVYLIKSFLNNTL